MNPISEISPIIQQQKMLTSNNFDSINNAIELFSFGLSKSWWSIAIEVFSSGFSNSLWSRSTKSTVVSRFPLMPLNTELHFSTYWGFAGQAITRSAQSLLRFLSYRRYYMYLENRSYKKWVVEKNFVPVFFQVCLKEKFLNVITDSSIAWFYCLFGYSSKVFLLKIV